MRNLACRSITFLLFLPSLAMAQFGGDDPKENRYASFRRPHSGFVVVQLENDAPISELPGFGNRKERDLMVTQMLNALLGEDDQVVKTIAKLLEASEQMIKVVPHSYWDSPEWLAWVRKAVNAPDDKIPERPEGKLLVSTYFSNSAPNQYSLVIEFSQQIDRPRDIAEAIAAELVQKFPSFSQKFLNSLVEKQLQHSVDDRERLNIQLKKVQYSIIEIGGTASQKILAETLADLRRQLLAAKLSLQAIDARESETQSQIKAATERVVKDSDSDEISAELEKLVDLRNAELQRLNDANREAPGAVSRGDIERAAARVVEARIQLLSAAAKKQSGQGSEQVIELNHQLAKLAIDRAETHAKLRFLASEIQSADKEMTESRNVEIRLTTLETELKGLRSEYDFCQKQLRALEKTRDVKAVHISIMK
jgi:hypothetical protein